MALLTNKTGVAATLQVAIGYDATEFDAFIREAQDFDLKPMLPEKFYFDMLKNATNPNYVKLLSGGDYEFEGITITFRGIIKAVDYFSYSRFVLNSSAISTSHGFVVKNTPNSTPLSLEERKNIHYKKITEGNSILQDVIKFIERNAGDYPHYFDKSCQNNNNNSAFTTRIIK
jgi:hypothetical protein